MQVEKDPQTDLNDFLEKVKIGHRWLDEVYNTLSAITVKKEDDDSFQISPSKRRERAIIIIDQNKEIQRTDFDFLELSSENNSSLEQSMFKKIFAFKEDISCYIVQNGFRHLGKGFGFYSLTNELIPLRMLYTKRITEPSDLFDFLHYHACFNEKEYGEICYNFWINFFTSFIYLMGFNVLILLKCFQEMKEQYIQGKSLKGVASFVDLTNDFQMCGLDQLLNLYDDFIGRIDELITPEFYQSLKYKLPGYIELMGNIEENLWSFVDQKINTSYLNFILCTSLFYEDFNFDFDPTSKLDQSPTKISSKEHLEKYIEEILDYGMDRFTEVSNLAAVRNSFFYHWRTLLGVAIPHKDHLINRIFDEKLHFKLTQQVHNIEKDISREQEKAKARKSHLRSILEKSILSCKNIGLLLINIPCNTFNKYTQVKLINKIEMIEIQCAPITKYYE